MITKRNCLELNLPSFTRNTHTPTHLSSSISSSSCSSSPFSSSNNSLSGSLAILRTLYEIKFCFFFLSLFLSVSSVFLFCLYFFHAAAHKKKQIERITFFASSSTFYSYQRQRVNIAKLTGYIKLITYQRRKKTLCSNNNSKCKTHNIIVSHTFV